MNFKRRNQSAFDELSNLSQRIFDRKIKSSKRKKIAQKNVDKFIERFVINFILTKKDISSNNRVFNIFDVVANVDFTRVKVNNASVKKIKEKHNQRQTLKVEIVARWHAKQTKEQIEWKTKIAKYDELETRRRHIVEFQIQKNNEIITMFDMKKFALKKKIIDFMITVEINYRVDKKSIWNHNYEENHLNDFDIFDLERMLNDVIQQRERFEQN